jgi:hypothetical protein
VQISGGETAALGFLRSHGCERHGVRHQLVAALSFALEISPMPDRDGFNRAFLCFELGNLSL